MTAGTCTPGDKERPRPSRMRDEYKGKIVEIRNVPTGEDANREHTRPKMSLLVKCTRRPGSGGTRRNWRD